MCEMCANAVLSSRVQGSAFRGIIVLSNVPQLKSHMVGVLDSFLSEFRAFTLLRLFIGTDTVDTFQQIVALHVSILDLIVSTTIQVVGFAVCLNTCNM